MAKRRKKKKLRFLLLFIFLIAISFLGYYLIVIKNSNEYKLKRKGYSETEVIEILKDKDVVNYFLTHDYNKLYLKFVNSKDYVIENLDKYINYYQNNNNAPTDDIVYLINNNIDQKYNKNLMFILNHKYYIKNNLDRYLAYLDKTSKSIDNIIANVNSNIDYDFYTNVKNTDISKDYLLIANKFYKLDSNYKNNQLVTMETSYTKVAGAQLEKTTYEAFKKLCNDAKNKGYYIVNTSAYRSYATQNYIYNNYKAENGQVWADAYSARPGYSEHQTGLALDVGTSSTTLGTFENTKEFIWIKSNAHKYGFILRYPKDKEYITGYNYEPWHYRYVGIEAASIIYENDLTFEEYHSYYVENKKDN